MEMDAQIIVVDGFADNSNIVELPGEIVAVLDHHVLQAKPTCRFFDIREEYGACATIVFDYYHETGIEPDDRFEQAARDEAAARGWKYERLSGDLSLLERLVDGRWDEEDFLVIAPGQRIAISYDERIVQAEPA